MVTVTVLLLLCPLVLAEVSSSTEDITLKFAEPIDVANKLLYDLDQQIQLLIKGQPDVNKRTTGNNALNLTYASPLEVPNKLEMMSKNAVPELKPELVKEPLEENNVANLLSNLGELDKKLQGTFQDLQTRRRYVLGAMIRQMQGTVRRIRSNVARVQSQLSSIESVATQVPLIRPAVQTVNGTSVDPTAGIVTANKELFEQLDQQISSVSKRINEIVTRLNSSLAGPGSIAEQPLNPIITLNSIIHSHNNRGPLIKPPKK